MMRLCGAAMMMLAITAAQSQGTPPESSGGRDVRVALFSTREVRTVTLTSLSPETWVAACAACGHRRLAAPMSFSGHGELFAGVALRVADAASGEQRSAVGLWHMKGIAGTVDVVLALPSERYVAAVLRAEVDSQEPAESLRAMAIVARSYALKGSHYAAPAGALKADLCDSTECQAARFGAVSDAVEQAVWDTAGETLWFGRRRAAVYFSQSCGGMTEEAQVAWPGLQRVTYLGAHTDPYCLRRGMSAWHTEVKLSELQSIAMAQGWRLPASIASVQIVRRSIAHRALLLEFVGDRGRRVEVSASALRLAIGRSLGWNRVRSDWYDLGVRNGAVVFDGRGFGHGVGLCQLGATEMAAAHKSAREILAFYFPGTRVGIDPEDTGWITESLEQLTVRRTQGLTVAQREDMKRSWQQAKALFPPRGSVSAEVVVAPSAELFRQMTSQPGWMLASTSGSRVVLQPSAVRGAGEQATLRHEMLHVLVESEATAKAPLWLREGLVEVLDGEAGSGGMSDVDLDAALRLPTTRDANEKAHRAAAARVKAMIARYGKGQVRSWLVSGVPANAK